MSVHSASPFRHRGFTIPEVLVVIGIIAVLIALLVPALSGTKRTAQLTQSMNNMRSIATFMRTYSTDNREHIVPSQFDYSTAAYRGKVRNGVDGTGAQIPVTMGLHSQGTWADILWVVNNLGDQQSLTDASGGDLRYIYDSPDTNVYNQLGGYDANPFRSAGPNSENFPIGTTGGATLPTPFGPGAQEQGSTGYFAANNFFNSAASSATYSGWYVTGQIKAPERSMYLVDSFAGETIEDEPAPYDTDRTLAPPTLQVDFRYNGACLMLFLDGHADTQAPWPTLADLQARGTRVTNLTSNTP